jgi:hypothetical protein
MKNKYEKIRLEWINFLERFSANQLDIKFDKTETIYVSFIMENILDTNISFSSEYGFLTVSFTEGKTKSRFFEIMKSFSENNKDENHNNFIINYPCKVFENKLMFNFYDNDNLLNDNDRINNRVYVFENLFNIIVKIKIENIKLNLF